MDHPDKKQMANTLTNNDEDLRVPFTFPRDVNFFPSTEKIKALY
ncbi:hypothetical protein C900_01263 [Fulvivirga imtechensis AK7]|uniref:Uncharacterized protein n=1 Tax=Fulvivirga imtechensis AK7 TaxID=1237149 RepID=L8JKI2_9BACT|nr:hypothetical protein C900_01263 [Fulvivirga imtechensis AK7]